MVTTTPTGGASRARAMAIVFTASSIAARLGVVTISERSAARNGVATAGPPPPGQSRTIDASASKASRA
ncbi:MAG: hypothetical protein ABEJ35_05505 [Halobacteriaceae archaeon]